MENILDSGFDALKTNFELLELREQRSIEYFNNNTTLILEKDEQYNRYINDDSRWIWTYNFIF